MASMSEWSVNRRQFLKAGLALAGGVAALGPTRAMGEDRSAGTRWALLSDTHVAADPENHYRGFYPYRNLQEIAGQIGYNLPDGVVITGDLARLKGEVDAYQNFKSLLAPITERRPVYLGLGNHDDREDFFQAFQDSVDPAGSIDNRQILTEVAGSVRLIVLDSLLRVDTNPGMLGQPQRVWLETFLQICDDRPTILFLHHTPRIDLLDTRRLFDIIAREPKVKAVVYGHSHKYRFSEYKGIHLINLPATGYNMSRNQPVGWVEAQLTSRGGEFTLHALAGNRKYDGSRTHLTWRS